MWKCYEHGNITRLIFCSWGTSVLSFRELLWGPINEFCWYYCCSEHFQNSLLTIVLKAWNSRFDWIFLVIKKKRIFLVIVGFHGQQLVLTSEIAKSHSESNPVKNMSHQDHIDMDQKLCETLRPDFIVWIISNNASCLLSTIWLTKNLHISHFF